MCSFCRTDHSFCVVGMGRLMLTYFRPALRYTPVTEADRKNNHKSKGTGLLKKRLENLNQKSNTRAYRIEYEDFDKNGKSAGTRV